MASFVGSHWSRSAVLTLHIGGPRGGIANPEGFLWALRAVIGIPGGGIMGIGCRGLFVLEMAGWKWYNIGRVGV